MLPLLSPSQAPALRRRSAKPPTPPENLASRRRSLPETLEHGSAASRQPVADLAALGEPELLELPDVPFEGQPLPTQRRREITGSHLGTVANQTQHRQRPITVTAGVEACEPPLHLGQLLAGQRVATAQLDARIRAGDAQGDPVHAAVALRGEVIHEGGMGRESCSACILIGDVVDVHLVDGVDGEHPDGRPEATPGPHPRPRPSPERDGDRAVGETVQDVALEEHQATLSPHLGETSLALLIALARRLHEPPLVALRIGDAIRAHAVGLLLGGLGLDARRLHAVVVRVDVVHPYQDELLGSAAFLLPVPGVPAREPDLLVADEHLGLPDASVAVDVTRHLFEPEHAREPVEAGGGVLVMQVRRDAFERHRAHRFPFSTYSANHPSRTGSPFCTLATPSAATACGSASHPRCSSSTRVPRAVGSKRTSISVTWPPSWMR